MTSYAFARSAQDDKLRFARPAQDDNIGPLERNFVFEFLAQAARRSGRRRPAAVVASNAVIAAARNSVARRAEHLHVVDHDLRRFALVPVFIVVAANHEPPLDETVRTLLEVRVAGFAEPVPGDDIHEGRLFLISRIVDRQRELRYALARLRVPDLGISRKIADQDDAIVRTCHAYSSFLAGGDDESLSAQSVTCMAQMLPEAAEFTAGDAAGAHLRPAPPCVCAFSHRSGRSAPAGRLRAA